jgi:List-Bact-rpt repeat protein
MNWKWFGVTALVVAAASALSLSSCAHNTHLVGINIIPGNGTFAAVDPSASFQYRAYGTYIHPPKTVDITNQVTWQSSVPQVAQFTGPGTVSPNTNCGVAPIFATMHDSPNDIISNQVSITVDGPVSLGCPQSTATNTLTVTVSPSTDGNVLSSPGAINCGESGNTTCSAQFSTNSSVVLTETPAPGHSFLGWSDACSGTVSTCTVFMSTNLTVTATFD